MSTGAIWSSAIATLSDHVFSARLRSLGITRSIERKTILLTREDRNCTVVRLLIFLPEPPDGRP